MDSVLEHSVDKNSPDDNLVDTPSEMFTDEHALDYSSPPLWDDYDDELFDLETINDDTYDDPFDSKEDKIKESKLLIDELDPPRSISFLPPKDVDIRVCGSFGSFFLDVIKSLSLEYEHVAMNLTLLERGRFIIRTSLTGFPAQSVRSSNADALDSLYLLVSLYRTPQSRLPH
ncbi:hypothetical protein Tco_1105009 [Tanacetum coccineum]